MTYDLAATTSAPDWRPRAARAPHEDDEPISVVPFPRIDPAAFYGLPGKIVEAVAPHTEAHPVAILVQLLARFGATVGRGPHLRIDNRQHPARLYPLIVGKTSDGAKGTSYGVVSALFDAGENDHDRVDDLAAGPLRRVSGLSTGEGLIYLVRDGNGKEPDDPGFDEGVYDKRLLIVEEEFTGVLATMDRQGNTLPRVLREAWDDLPLQTLTRAAPMQATGAHITLIGHCTPGELRIKLSEAAMLGGTMNRLLPVASRRTKLLPEGGNIPAELIAEFGDALRDATDRAAGVTEVERDDDARKLWRQSYPALRRTRPDGPVATILARSAPQVLRVALAYALADSSDAITGHHLTAALAIWRYVEDTAEWMFSAHVAPADLDPLVDFIAAAGGAGRAKSEISIDFYSRNKPAPEIDAVLGELIKDGRIRQETEQRTGPGRRAVRYYT